MSAEREKVLEAALRRAGEEITYLLDGCIGPPPVWISEALAPALIDGTGCA